MKPLCRRRAAPKCIQEETKRKNIASPANLKEITNSILRRSSSSGSDTEDAICDSDDDNFDYNANSNSNTNTDSECDFNINSEHLVANPNDIGSFATKLESINETQTSMLSNCVLTQTIGVHTDNNDPDPNSGQDEHFDSNQFDLQTDVIPPNDTAESNEEHDYLSISKKVQEFPWLFELIGKGRNVILDKNKTILEMSSKISDLQTKLTSLAAEKELTTVGLHKDNGFLQGEVAAKDLRIVQLETQLRELEEKNHEAERAMSKRIAKARDQERELLKLKLKEAEKTVVSQLGQISALCLSLKHRSQLIGHESSVHGDNHLKTARGLSGNVEAIDCNDVQDFNSDSVRLVGQPVMEESSTSSRIVSQSNILEAELSNTSSPDTVYHPFPLPKIAKKMMQQEQKSTRKVKNPRPCQHCPLVLAKQSMKMHIRHKHGLWPAQREQHVCTECSRDFPSSGTLRTHKETHEERKPCPFCYSLWTHKSQLRHHIKNKHPEAVSLVPV